MSINTVKRFGLKPYINEDHLPYIYKYINRLTERKKAGEKYMYGDRQTDRQIDRYKAGKRDKEVEMEVRKIRYFILQDFQ